MPSSRLAPIRELFSGEIPYTEHIFPAIILLLMDYCVFPFLKTRSKDSYWALMCGSALWGILVFSIWYFLSKEILPIGFIKRFLRALRVGSAVMALIAFTEDPNTQMALTTPVSPVLGIQCPPLTLVGIKHAHGTHMQAKHS